MAHALGQLTTWQKALLLGGVAFLGYCIYFDRKRRSDPLYREKVIARKSVGMLRKDRFWEICWWSMPSFPLVFLFFKTTVGLPDFFCSFFV